ncbi:MAG TPA: DUF3276 family protein [Bacteroidales bacterium]|nr:DUF3276 family protein [Bacteroidales bacterium]HPT09587.1 DUF3276 family protein [Bacteroidales bacterium]
MEDFENKDRERGEIFSRAVRAGKRTYFFDVKATIGEEHYLTITESKRRFNNEQGKFVYEKHKLFLYKEDFEKFHNGLSDAIEFIRTGKAPERAETIVADAQGSDLGPGFSSTHTNIEFEDLSPDSEKI